ncbi:MAG: hypothetical protein EXQ52_06940 [Bryobacterales bacterium]|nr:hypothetical protein [Bryobacterales bacterium]
MPNEDDPEPAEAGIAGLPKSWAVAVQLVGTFGLAVFLVLYYVLVMQPKDAERYERLRQSVTSLGEIVAGQQSLLTREQTSQLEDLFVMAMANEVADLIVGDLKGNSNAEALSKKIEDTLILQTRLLEGLRRKDGGTISEMLTHKIRNSGIGQEVARRAVAEWRSAERATIANECRGALNFAIKRAAMAK